MLINCEIFWSPNIILKPSNKWNMRFDWDMYPLNQINDIRNWIKAKDLRARTCTKIRTSITLINVTKNFISSFFLNRWFLLFETPHSSSSRKMKRRNQSADDFSSVSNPVVEKKQSSILKWVETGSSPTKIRVCSDDGAIDDCPICAFDLKELSAQVLLNSIGLTQEN